MSVSILVCLAALISVACGQRRVGLQGFQINNTLWLDGGQYINLDGSTSPIVPTLSRINLTIDFEIPPGPTVEPQSRPSEVPIVSYGVIWSNLVDCAWLFGGKSEANSELPNSLWRFQPGNRDAQWTSIDISHSNASGSRPSNGAGCNVPALQTGYYLGGTIVSDDVATSGPHFLHSLTEFNMQTETLSSLNVPDFVPVVNQSLVFFNTGVKKGVLVALGGYTERNGSLTIAPLSSIFIYDISSQIWTEQEVTDEQGHTVEDEKLGFEPSVGIPRKRFNTCATAGSAQDKTSHNIFILGGQNKTDTFGDAWVLSLPSAVWIKAPLPDTTNGPKSENSCVLLNSRYVLMYGGCFQDQNPYRPCASYSYDPLLFDITKPGWARYTFHINGYFVRENVFDIIGGDALGGSSHSSPMFSTFADPDLQALFHPPYSTRHQDYNALVRIALPVLLSLPFLPTSIYIVVNSVLSAKVDKQKNSTWKPWALQYPYLLFVNFTTISLIATVIFLYKRSESPDPNPEHWTGGLDSAGTWIGRQFESQFIPPEGLGKPPQGLLSAYYDQGRSGEYSQKNFTKRISGLAYWAFTYMPMLIAVIYGRIWKVLDDEVKRTEVYVQLSKQHGCTGKSSLCLNYHSFWTPLAILQAIRYRHWTVALSSTGSVLASTVIPVIQNYAFVWQLYSGASLAWPDTYSWEVAIADPFWSLVLVALLSVTLLCSFSLITRQTQSLIGHCQGIASTHELILGEDYRSLQFSENADRQAFSKLCSELGPLHFRLCRGPVGGDVRLEICNQSMPASQPSNTLTKYIPFKETIQRQWAKLKPASVVFKWPVHSISHYFTSYPHFFLFRRVVFSLWLLLLLALLAFGIFILRTMNENAQAEQWNYAVPLSPNIYITVGVFVQSIYDVLEHNVRSVTVFDALQHGYQSPRILWIDYSCGIPVYEVFVAHGNSHYLLTFVLLGSLATAVYTIFLGSLQLSTSYYGATSFHSDLTAATVSTALIAFILLVSLAVGWRFCRRGFLLRPPNTLAATIPWMLFSPGLTEDLEGVKDDQGIEAKIQKLEEWGRRYAFGVFKDRQGKDRLGIERQYHDGTQGRSNIDLKGQIPSV